MTNTTPTPQEHYITLKEQCKAANEKIIAMVKDYRYYSARREIDIINKIISEA